MVVIRHMKRRSKVRCNDWSVYSCVATLEGYSAELPLVSFVLAMESKGSAAGQQCYYVAVGIADAKLATLVELLQALKVDTRLALAVACSSRDSLDSVAHALASCKGFNIAVLHADLELHDVERQVLQIKRCLQPQQPPLLHTKGSQLAGVDAAQLLSDQQQQQQQGPTATAAAGPGQAAAGQAADAACAQADLQAAAAATGHQQGAGDSAGIAGSAWDDGRSIALVTSDACLRGLSKDLTPLGLPLLIQYDLPASKDVLSRRLAAVFGSSKERSRRAGRQVVVDFVAAGEVAAFRARERLSAAPVLEMPVHVPDIFC